MGEVPLAAIETMIAAGVLAPIARMAAERITVGVEEVIGAVSNAALSGSGSGLEIRGSVSGFRSAANTDAPPRSG
jgi:hypothetical protein